MPIKLYAYIDVIVSVSYFAAYEVTKKRLTPAGSTDLSLSAVIFAGGTAGVAMWTIAIPPDVSIIHSHFFLVSPLIRSFFR